jgi:hypothetical protein
MKKGLNNIIRDGRSGMPALHMQAIQQVARDLDIVIAIRPVKKVAQEFIEAGYPTKPYEVKNKTTDMGVAAGLIVINPEYSQVPEDDYRKYHQQLQTAFSKNAQLSQMPCVLSESRIHTLKSFFGDDIDITSSSASEHTLSWKKQDKIITVTARKNSVSNDYTIYDAAGTPLQVLSKEVVNGQGEKTFRPITSDYDLLAVCPSYNDLDLNGKDKTPFSMQGSLRRIQLIIKASALPFYFGPKQDPKRGHVSERDRDVLEAINKQIKKMDKKRQGENLDTVHHGAELRNPSASELSQNLPSLFILADDFVLVENESELQKFCGVLHQNNYYWPPHSKYPDLTVQEPLLKFQ